jgi:4-hydroxy-tetrahydrodipicolinate reductase
MIKLALVGYGKMGKEIESVLDPNEFTLTGKYDINNDVKDILKDRPDAAIEFSTPNAVIENIGFLASNKINIVCGTTGWYDKAEEVKKIVSENNIGFIYASNFSVGVNIFFQIVKYSSELMDKFGQYDIGVEETHHTQKLDKPSGTAIRIAEYISAFVKRKKIITNDKTALTPEELNIISKRIENVVGNHKVIFNSAADTITLEHNAKSRRGFAEGALLAAKFIHGKKGFFKFEDIFNKLI